MAEEDVAAVFGPQWVRDALLWEQNRNRMAERIIFALRSRLRGLDPSLPEIYNGPAWWDFEQAWEREAQPPSFEVDPQREGK